jgi:hypothetical protein
MNDLPEEKDYEDIVRKMIWHEDEVINHRVGWLTTVNGLLFTALAFLWGKTESRFVIVAICVLGCTLSSLIYTLLFSATRAMARLKLFWAQKEPPGYKGPGIMGVTAISPSFYRAALWVNQWDLIALLFALAWAFVLIIVVCHWKT